jgi:hypothetical protein
MASGATNLAPAELVGTDVPLREFRVPTARDVVVVAPLEDGGLISYKRANGAWVHTLNTAEGFERKLVQLHIALDLRE